MSEANEPKPFTPSTVGSKNVWAGSKQLEESGYFEEMDKIRAEEAARYELPRLIRTGRNDAITPPQEELAMPELTLESLAARVEALELEANDVPKKKPRLVLPASVDWEMAWAAALALRESGYDFDVIRDREEGLRAQLEDETRGREVSP